MVEATVTPLYGDDPAKSLKLRGDIIRGLQQNLIHGGHSLETIPESIALIVEKDMWQEWADPTSGEVRHYRTFEEFARAPVPDGLGSEVRTLKNLCRDDKTALDALDRATVGEHGGDRKSAPIKSNNITLEDTEKSVTGTSNTYALRKLRKDRPDLHERVLKDEISPHAAMIEAGFRKKTITVPSDVEKAARTLLKHFDPDELYRAMKGGLG